MRKFYLILFSIISLCTSAQELLKEIVTSNASSHPRNMVNANGKHFFLAKGVNSSTQLWVTDGTGNGTIQVTSPGTNGSPYIDGQLHAIGNKVAFVGYSYQNGYNYYGYELWISDGTSSGTYLVKDINPGTNSSYPGTFLKFGDKLVFWANNGSNGSEPWITDGTENGTMLLSDFYPGTSSSYINNSTDYVISGSKLYFTVSSQDRGYELAVTDGTPWGTSIVKDIEGGTNSSYPTNLRAIGNKVIFTAYNNSYGTELWISDGTEGGTSILKDIYSGFGSSSPSGFIELNGKFIFRADSYNMGSEVWITDGTTNGTKLIKDIYSGYYSSYPQDFLKVGNTVFFSATDGISGRELWKTNGTAEGTLLVKDINLTSILDESLTFSSYSTRRKFIDINGKLFFLANSGSEGFELWKSDGTSAGTTLVKDFIAGPASPEFSNFQVTGSFLYFSVKDNADNRYYYRTDGTAEGTIEVSKLNPSLEFENVYTLISINNQYFYFSAYNSLVGYELFKVTGNTINLVKDIDTSPLFFSSNFQYKAGVNNNLIFNYNNNLNGNELWKTDGRSNTNLLMDIRKYPDIGSDYYSNSSSIYSLCSFNNYVYSIINNNIWRTNGETTELFNSSNGSVNGLIVSNNKLRWVSSNQLFETDGNTITLITTLSDYSYYSSNLIGDVNGITYFSFSTYTHGQELWRTDGTSAGTWMVKDINWGTGSTYIGNGCKVGNKLFFVVYDNINFGTELWITDGTDGGTYIVKDIYPGSYSAYPNYLTNLNDNLLIFAASDGNNGTELWRSDGTEGGTYMISDIYSGSYGSSPTPYEMGKFPVFNNKVYFEAYTTTSYKLFASDGNSVSVVKDRIDPEAICVFKNELYFRASNFDNPRGYELWKSDGTTAGTTLVKDINEGPNSSGPRSFYSYKDILYFIADDGKHGYELWALTPCADSLNINTTLTGLNNYQAGRVIVGETANTISSTAKITYDAGKYILFQPGFITNEGAVFETLLQGCSNAPLKDNISNIEPQKRDKKTEEYIQDMHDAPAVEDFIEKGNNLDLRIIWAKFLEDSKPITDKERQLNLEMITLGEQSKTIKADKNQEILANHHSITAEKEKNYNLFKQQTAQYNYFIQPIRDKNGKKLGYDLTIYAGGKVYQSSIRN
ncbi:3-coathanger stack domain-containing protein [Emticicia sp. C21]|uniref:3-coathanger stack domain-containing protein n=1 Tax=Emticicia sp. C21 TaxID=2302915 RepID=UPI000E357ADD|nr:3-coathanger stack domain-containing protein [Emticicia sp. C21]RFS13754.1 hypothetical protein D0T08_24745 [Emticicia sp. C21]